MKLNNEQKKALYEEGYKFCFDVVKLILGGVIFAGIMQDNIDRTRLYAWGVFFMVLIVALGMYFIIKSKNKKTATHAVGEVTDYALARDDHLVGLGVPGSNDQAAVCH